MPLGIKDLFCVEGVPAQAGVAHPRGLPARPTRARSPELWEAGAVCIGKLNMDEFAMGSSNETSVYGPAVSPWRRPATPRR